MRAHEILTEYNQAALMRNFGDKLLAKWKGEGSPYSDEIKGESEGEVTPDDIINWIEQYDPTQNNKYMTWIVGKYAGKKGGIQRLEDIASRLQDHLERYERLSRTNKLNAEHKDINQIKTLVDLSQIVKQYEDEEVSSQTEPTEITNANVEVVYNGPDYFIQIPKTFEASKELAKDTEWCTAYPNNYKTYSSQGPLYAIEDKKTGEKWQWHFETKQYMDVNDRPIKMRSFINKHKLAANKVISHYGGMPKAVEVDPRTWILFINRPSAELQIRALTSVDERDQDTRGEDFSLMHHMLRAGIVPSEEVQLVSVTHEDGEDGEDGVSEFAINDLIEGGIRPNETVQMAAVMGTGYALKYIIDAGLDPSYAVQMAAVKECGMALRYIDNPSQELIVAAVKRDGSVLKHVDNPSEELQMAAIASSSLAILAIDNPNEKLQMAGVKKWGHSIGHIIKSSGIPSEEIQMAAVQKDGSAISHIIKAGITPSDAMIMSAIKQDGKAIQFFKNPSEELQMAAITQTPHALQYIIKAGITPSEEVQMATITQNPWPLRYIENPSEAVKQAAADTEESQKQASIARGIKRLAAEQ